MTSSENSQSTTHKGRAWQTEDEILAQPDIWEAWCRALPQIAGEVHDWAGRREARDLWLCGAGSSAFIGDTLARHLTGNGRWKQVCGVPTTDLVASPELYLRDAEQAPLVVSFGRSGNSSESVGTLDLLDRRCPAADRLSITCNKAGVLASRAHPGPGRQHAIVLPSQCHDRGFAMTSSYTTMLLSALACLSDIDVEAVPHIGGQLADAARGYLDDPLILERPKRAVFLGSGPLLGSAREAALKVLELSAGRVVTAWDTTLGFRHGPKAIIDAQTTVFVFMSNDPLTRKYDSDIVDELKEQFPDTTTITVGADGLSGNADIHFQGVQSDVWNAVLYVLVAQALSVTWSKSLGLNLDNPFEGGQLSRVVSHVQLYT